MEAEGGGGGGGGGENISNKANVSLYIVEEVSTDLVDLMLM